jgi:hypothetical protein
MPRLSVPSLTLPRLTVALTFLGLLAMAARPSADTDTWWHLRVGQWIVEQRAVPQTDVFSHTRAGAAWRIPGWIVQVPLYLAFANLGYAGLNLFTAACVLLTFVFVYRMCSGPPLLRAFTLVLAAAASALYWAARPAIISFLLAGAFAYILWLYRWRGLNRLWLLPPLMALWANAHGGFALGFILLALTLAGQVASLGWRWVMAHRERAGASPAPTEGDVDGRGIVWLIGIGLACAAAVMFNPAGPEMLLYPFKTVSIGVLQDFIQEWQSPNFHTREAQPFLWLLLATLVSVALSGRRANLTDLLLVCGVAYSGFLAARNVVLLAIVAPPLLTPHAAALGALRERWAKPDAPLLGGRPLDEPSLGGTPLDEPSLGGTPREPFAGSIIINWFLLIVIALVVLLRVVTILPRSVNEEQIAKVVPVQAADYVLRERPPGPIFNAYNFGAYLMWRLYPDYPVYVDGRTDLYDDAFLREYLDVALGRSTYEQTLDKYGVNLILIDAGALLTDRLREDARWQKVYGDSVAEVYRRVTP